MFSVLLIHGLQVITDLQEECGKYGTVLRVSIPRPADPSQSFQLAGTGNFGKAFVQVDWNQRRFQARYL